MAATVAPPCGECGLKYAEHAYGTKGDAVAPPCGECGLKSPKYFYKILVGGRSPLRGVWIEILSELLNLVGQLSRSPLRGVWIEIAPRCCLVAC